MKIVVTGGAGFIGSAVIRHIIKSTKHSVVNIDKLTYAANPENLRDVEDNERYAFAQADICDRGVITKLFAEHAPDAVMHLAAESHVDRSIEGPAEFIETNIIGTYTLLEVTRDYLAGGVPGSAGQFRFHHISTDEVYGDLEPGDAPFSEETPYRPSSPYSASKASSDHLVRSWCRTYDLPVVLSNCSNNYGPYQYPEKLIPVVILNARAGKPIPVYGEGRNVRDWLYVEDHARALLRILEHGSLGESYNVGGECEIANIDLVRRICRIVDEEMADDNRAASESLITFVEDRPGHDFRYAMNIDKIRRELEWAPSLDIDEGLRRTVRWYLDNDWWWRPLTGDAGEREDTGS